MLKNEIEEISKLEGFMETIGEATGIDLSLIVSLNLALEEAVTNVISYAYPEGQEGTVDIDVRVTKEQLEFVISDSGIPFDPTTKEDADITLGVEERPIGGLGIFLVRQLMDTILYEYKDKKNILTLRKQLTANN
ncbi:MAG: ATP-binding protein [Prevotella sp.]|nr:ATP-binding protein [Prevotella sp.]